MYNKKDFITKFNIRAARVGWRKYCDKIRDLFWVSKIDFLLVDLSSWQQPKLPRMRKNVQFEFGDIDDIHKINANPHLEAHDEAEHNIQLLKAGNKIIVGRVNNEIVFYAWAVFGRKSMHNKFFELQLNEFIAMRAFVQKEYRGFALYSYGLIHMFKKLKNEDYKVCFMDIESHNIISQRSTYKLGAKGADSGYYLINFLWKQYALPFGILANRFVGKKARTERI